MPTSSDTYAISLPVDPRCRYALTAYLVIVTALVAATLAVIAGGSGRLFALAPVVAALFPARRLARTRSWPCRVGYRPEGGWVLAFSEETIPVRLLPGSRLGRSMALMAFSAGGRRHWLLLVRRREEAHAVADWRRLRVLWRTRRDALVANSSNC